jgi:hypothetical protein
MSELRQRIAPICELYVFIQLLFFAALGLQMEYAGSRTVRPESFSHRHKFCRYITLLFADLFAQIALTLEYPTTDNPSINTKVPHAAGNLSSNLGIDVPCVDNPARVTLTVERN